MNQTMLSASTSPPPAPAGDAGEETVEAYRRYPAPEMVTVQPRKAAATTAAPSGSHTSESDSHDETTPQEDTSSASLPRLSLRLRWCAEAAELRRLYEMHEEAFPISYSPTFYEWVLNHDACVSLLALATPEEYAAYQEHWKRTRVVSDDAPQQQQQRTDSNPAEASSPSSGPAYPPVPPPISQAALTPEILMERANVDRVISELEHVAERKAALQGKPTQTSTATTTAAAAALDASDAAAAADAAATHTVVVGFVIGQLAYARHEAGHLCTNPTAYVGSFAVDPALQGCGIGDLLLHRFVHYVTELRPVYAHDYLHYNERKLVEILAEAQVKKRHAATETDSTDTATVTADDVSVHKKTDGDAIASATTRGAASSATTEKVPAPSLLHRLAVASVPELHGWLEDRHARRELRRRGLTEDAIDAQRFNDSLAPDALTDEEAEEVRRESRRFLVQTGVPEVWLHCLPGNMQATSFYSKRGFTVHRTLKDYYNINEHLYDAHLLRYLTPTNDAAQAAASASAAAAAQEVEKEEDAVAEAAATAEAAAPAASSEGAKTEPALPAGGLRRRREEAPAPAPVPVDASDTFAAAAPPLKGLAATPSSLRHSSSTWLHPGTYGSVADVVLCTTEDGQKEWRARTAPGGAGAGGPLGWWEKVREWGLVVNALALLSAVLWLAYNVWVTGKVE